MRGSRILPVPSRSETATYAHRQTNNLWHHVAGAPVSTLPWLPALPWRGGRTPLEVERLPRYPSSVAGCRVIIPLPARKLRTAPSVAEFPLVLPTPPSPPKVWRARTSVPEAASADNPARGWQCHRWQELVRRTIGRPCCRGHSLLTTELQGQEAIGWKRVVRPIGSVQCDT